MTRTGFLIALAAASALAQTPSDADIWREYGEWVESLQPLPPGERQQQDGVYAKHLASRGVPASEAERRLRRIRETRGESAERQRIYWNAAFKLGAGPDDPSRIVQEAVYKVKPGRALDAGMGRGRDAVWLASMGWDVTGYDLSPDALKIANARAAKSGVKIQTAEAAHESFEFGEDRWDLIVCIDNYMSLGDTKMIEVLHRALRPGGRVVFQAAMPEAPNEPLDRWNKLLARWTGFRLLRFENLEPGAVENDWPGHLTNRTIRFIVQKPR